MINPHSYVLVTAAYNEGKYIDATIRSVIAQELLPTKWIIVSDGSADSTDAIVEKYAGEHSFIQLHRLTKTHPRNFAAQANAINAGFEELQHCPSAFIGNLDADVTFEPTYFRLLLAKFIANPQLGVGGGCIYERSRAGVFRPRPLNRPTSVAHAVQMFRRECFEAVGGGYPPLPYGAPDTYAETTARMKGWQVTSFSDLPVFHHRPTSSVGGPLRGCFRQGRMDYSLGVLPFYEILKLLNRLTRKPYVLGALARLAGFIYSYSRGDKPAVPDEFVSYLRHEQELRLATFFRTGRRVES